MIEQFYFQQFNLACHLCALSLNVKQFYLSIYKTLSGATSPSQSGPGSDGNEGVILIPQSFSITGASPSFNVISRTLIGGEEVLLLSRYVVSVFCNPSLLGFAGKDEQLYMDDLCSFGLVLWHINYCRLFNAKSSLYIYIKYTSFGLVWLYGISTIVGYLMLNLLYTYIKYMISKLHI